MIDGLIGGKLYGQPTQRISKTGKPFAIAKVRAAAGDGESLFVNVIAFDDAPVAALLGLGDGDSVALSGSLTPKVWTDKEGNTKMVSQKRSSFEGLRYNGDMSQFEKKAFETTAFEKKKFDGAATQFETRKWDGVKSFTDGKLETPDFIARAKGVNTQSWQDASKQYATQQSDLQGRSWKEADKHLGRTVNRDIEAKRQSFEQPTMMSARQAQARTIQETREMMGRTD